MKQHQITGVGPTAPDGSVKIFTVAPQPLHVDSDTLAAWGAHPQVGDTVQEDEDGALSLNAGATATEAEGEDEAKKADGSAAAGTGSEPSPNPSPDAQAPAPETQPPQPPLPLPQYTANPYVVSAGQITAVDGSVATLENGETVDIHKEILGTIGVGDYWVIDQEDDSRAGFIKAATFATSFTPKEA